MARLSGLWLAFARAAWLVIAALAVATLIASIPNYIRLIGVVTEQEQAAGMLLHDPALLSPSPRFEFWTDLVYGILSFSASVLCLVLAAIIYRKKQDERMAYVTSLTLLVFGVVMTGPVEMLVGQRLSGESIALFVQMLLWGFVLFLFYIFPDGRFQPRWTRWFSLFLVPWAIALAFWNPIQLPPSMMVLFMIVYTVPSLTAPIAQIYRYRRVSSIVQRLQTKWVVFGFSAWILGGTLVTGIFLYLASLFFNPSGSSVTGWSEVFVFAGRMIWPVSLLLVPTTLTLAVLRYRLFDIDVIINRTLVYATLSGFVVSAYLLVVTLLSTIFETSGNLLISILATASIAIVFQPLRERLQRAVNRMMYGERDDPYGVLSQIGKRLEAIIVPEAVLPAITTTVAQTLKLPYVAISFQNGDNPEIVAAYGQASAMLTHFPLNYLGAPIGLMIVSRRSEGEDFSPSERRLLEDIAHQTSPALYAVGITSDLRRSREKLVLAREEERRRLRRDLHDGLGATLAALNLQMGSLRTFIEKKEPAEMLIGEMRVEIHQAISDIRQLVYNLRPPALDELGLRASLLEQATRFEGAGLRVMVDVPEQLPALPAAVEVAIYRIVQEALANIAHHAHAHTCSVCLGVKEGIHLEISDDGIGISPEHISGVGLLSMRERAAELEGTCTFESNSSGTRVRVYLPFLEG